MEIYLVLGIGVLALLFSAYKSAWVGRQDAGEGKMTKIAGYIADGALAFGRVRSPGPNRLCP